MGSLGAPEILVIFLVALIVLGPDRLPKAARQVGRAVSEFKRISGGFQDEVRKAIDFDGDGTPGSKAAGSSGPAASNPASPPVSADSTPTPGDGGAYGGRPAPAMSQPDIDLPPPPDDPSRN